MAGVSLICVAYLMAVAHIIIVATKVVMAVAHIIIVATKIVNVLYLIQKWVFSDFFHSLWGARAFICFVWVAYI
jgi:hypothetical protein